MDRVVSWLTSVIGAAWGRGAADGWGARRWLSNVGLVLGLLLPAFTAAQTWQYLYDEVGRLKSAIAPSGDRADYEYDAVGNIVAIRRSAAGALNISEFTPQIGKGGTSVKLIGSGFSTTLASNTVKFNGVTATVTAATATQLTVTAPNTGTTGPISVTAGANTVTTREAFVYLSTIVTGPPTIATASPTCAVPGTSVTLTGTNFDVAPGATRVELGNVVAPTTVASNTSLSFVVPLGASSAMRVVTPFGISASSTLLFVPLVGTCSEYETRVQPVLNGAASTVAITTAGKKAVVLFSGNAGAALSLQFTNIAPSVAGTPLSYTLYNPANTSIASGLVHPAAASIHLPLLPVSGTYAVVFAWSSATVTGNASVQLKSNSVLGTSGAALITSVAAPGQSARVTFSGVAGKDWTLDISGLTLSTGGQYLGYQVLRSDGVSVYNGLCYPSGTGCITAWRPMTAGTHTIVLTPSPNTVTGSMTLKSWASSRVTGTLVSGTPTAVNLTQPGQQAWITFTGTAGQDWTLDISGLTMSAGGQYMGYQVLRSDGVSVHNGSCYPSGTGCATVWRPMTAGTHTVVLTPYPNTATGSMTLKSWVSSWVTGTLTMDTPATYTSTVPGQAVAYTFSGTAGDLRQLSLSAFTTSIAGAKLTAEVRRPDGLVIRSHNFSAADTTLAPRVLHLSALPSTGIYSVVVYPYLSGNAQQTTTFSGQVRVAPDAPEVLATDGSVTGVYMDALQSGTRTVTFTGVAGKDWTLDISNLALSTGGNYVQYQVFQNGSVSMGSGQCYSSGSGCSLTWLAMTAGTHSIVFTRQPAGISAAFNLRSWVSNRVTGTLAVGSPTTLTTTVPGQMAQYTFSGNAGQQVSIAFSNFTTSVSGASLSAGVVSLLFGSFTGAQTTPSPYVLNLPPLPTTGTYTLQVSPQSSATTFTGQVTLSVGGTFLTDGTPTTVTFSTPGATVDLSFTATYDDELSAQLSLLALNGGANDTAQYTLVTPGGFIYSPLTCSESGANCAATWVAFNQDGTYKLRLTAQAGLTGSVRVQAWKYQPLTGVLYLGFPVTMTTTLPSQTARYTFDGFTGQRVRLTLSNASSSTGASGVFAQVFTPSYGYVGMVFINVGAGPQFVDLPALTTDGEYRVVVQAAGFGHKFSVQVRLDPY